jgi:hypothetical protein
MMSSSTSSSLSQMRDSVANLVREKSAIVTYVREKKEIDL